MAKPRRVFTADFKSEVVNLVLMGAKSMGQVSQELDLTESAVRVWVRQARIESGHGPVGALTSDERDEL